MSGETLRDRLVAAKISGAKTGQGYEFRTNENAADVAIAVVAEWLRAEAGDVAQRVLADDWHRSQCGCNQWPASCRYRSLVPATWTAHGLAEALADSLSPTPAETTEEAQP